MSYDPNTGYQQDAGGQEYQDDQQYEEPLSPVEELENRDGLRLCWRAWPNTKIAAKKYVVPLAAIYTPLKNRNEDWYPETGWHVKYEPQRCSNKKCGGVINPFCEVNLQYRHWQCGLCSQQNTLDNRIQADAMELLKEGTTIDYVGHDVLLHKYHEQPNGSPVFIYCIDTAVSPEELKGLCDTINESIDMLPKDALVGLITYGKHVCVHELSFDTLLKTVVIGGEAGSDDKPGEGMGVLKVKQLLGIDSVPAHNPFDQTSPIWRYIVTVEGVKDFLKGILSDLSPDPWAPGQKERKARCTGAAAQAGIALLSAFQGGYGGRLMLFCGGAATVGPGKIVSTQRGEHPRSYMDIEKGTAKFYDDSITFYTTLAKIAAEQGHVVDMFAGCLDLTGLAEQRVLVERTGGFVVLSDTFTTDIFKTSFRKLFAKNEDGTLKMCFNAVTKVLCSRNIQVAGCIGPVTSMGETGTHVAERETGIGGTCQWSLGGLDDNTNLTFVFEVNDSTPIQDCSTGMVQFLTTYRTGAGVKCTRVTSFQVMFLDVDKRQGKMEIQQDFDQDAAAVALTKIAVHKKDTEVVFQPMRWVDNQLIRFMKKVAQYTPGQPQTFQLAPQFEFFPQFLFYLRRSPFLDQFGYSPDESAFRRMVMLKENVENVVKMVEPELFSWSSDNPECTAVDLGSSAMQATSILLLDSFFNIVIWYGNTMRAWREDENLREDPTYEWLFELLARPDEELNERANSRAHYPITIWTHKDESQERFLTSKLNPEPSQSQYGEQSQILTENVSLTVFKEHLRKLVVDDS